ncbi:MAG TPA: tetratricopeptide repeat protein [Verrucomicrobiae bacterium]|jgi:TolA-binding protein|nr:tetratricopeptide repeat protein [Verrucomicrobiae bacterium]
MTAQPASGSHLWRYLSDGLALIVFLGLVGWALFRILKKSDDPARLLFKWVLTVVNVSGMFVLIGPMMKEGGYGAAFGGIPAAAVGGVFLAMIWRRDIADMVANPIGDLYDGGTTPMEAKPFYSQAIAHRKRGHYQEALASIRKELDKFPADLEGQLLLADLQAENLNDLPGAAITIERICNQSEHPPGNIALALNTLADWYLKLNQDRDTARETLQRIIDRFPDSELSARAAQRIASLASTEHLLAAHDRKKFIVTEGVQNLGLLDPKFHPAPADPDAAKQAVELVEHLQAHPLDAEAREQLALIYANHYHRMDLAMDQLEQLITFPNQPPKRVAHWLNLLADLQIRNGGNYDTIRATLQRIIDLFPGAAAAQVAASRITHLKLELKGKEKIAAVKLGTYEQDIGLKMGKEKS